MKKSHSLPLLLTGVLLCGAGSLFGQAVADFDGGNSSSVVDGYKGMAGGGWTGAWSTTSTNSAVVSGTVVSTNPLVTDSGNYLSGTVSGPTTNSANSQGYIGRVINAASFDYTQPLQLSFLFQPETTVSGSQLYRILGNAGSVTNATSATNMFVISSGSVSAPTWQFNNSTTQVDSGMAVVTGDVYSFSLSLNMQANTYTATVTDLTASTVAGSSVTWTSGTLSFRDTAAITNFALEFGALLATGGAQTSANSVSFNVDSISVSAIPEPATAGMFFGIGSLALGGVMVWRRRRVDSRCLAR